ncbi:MAG TPA: 2-hydroxyglutaryl-CoA dehydratase [Firmicutes bacterium]|nr:2-hydroxyglutaryl-CoA dehydratase [Candidatus Fermentithermobacillaceae bacterium]
MITVGIDSGSTATKVAVVSGGRILAAVKAETGTDPALTASLCLDDALKSCGLSRKDVVSIVTTGYGRDLIPGRKKSVTEITCHARGASQSVPGAKTVVDIGGQDSKIIRLDGAGLVLDFVMNDKCAAGTGRFLEVMAGRLGLDLKEFEREWKAAREASKISSTCTVFAESEVVSLISQGVSTSSVVRGLCDAIASRIASMGRRVGIERPVVLTGGVSLNGGVRRSLERVLGSEIVVPPMSVFMGAYGAALIAASS